MSRGQPVLKCMHRGYLVYIVPKKLQPYLKQGHSIYDLERTKAVTMTTVLFKLRANVYRQSMIGTSVTTSLYYPTAYGGYTVTLIVPRIGHVYPKEKEKGKKTKGKKGGCVFICDPISERLRRSCTSKTRPRQDLDQGITPRRRQTLSPDLRNLKL